YDGTFRVIENRPFFGCEVDGEFISLGRALLKNATVDHLTGELRMEAPLPQGSGSNDPRRNILLCDLPSRALERFLPGAVRSLKLKPETGRGGHRPLIIPESKRWIDARCSMRGNKAGKSCHCQKG